MAQVTKHYCDWEGCKAERVGERSILAFSHSQMCASGNGSDQWHATFDLCAKHLIDYIYALTEVLERHGRFGPVVKISPFEVVKKLKIKFELR
jgi:hypothetical protein